MHRRYGFVLSLVGVLVFGRVSAAGSVPAAGAGSAAEPDNATPPPIEWTLLVSTARARAAVFTDRQRRLTIAAGARLPGTPWQVESVGDDRVVLTTIEPQTRERLDVPLHAGERAPVPPTPKTVGAGTVEVPFVTVVDRPDKAP